MVTPAPLPVTVDYAIVSVHISPFVQDMKYQRLKMRTTTKVHTHTEALVTGNTTIIRGKGRTLT